MVERGETRDKESKVGGVVVLHSEFVHHQEEGNRARGVAEKTGGKILVKVKGLKQRDKSEIGKLTCLFEAVQISIDFNELRFRKWRFKIEIS